MMSAADDQHDKQEDECRTGGHAYNVVSIVMKRFRHLCLPWRVTERKAGKDGVGS